MQSELSQYNKIPGPGLLETIRVENGILKHVGYHNTRFNKTRRDLFGIDNEMQLEPAVIIPDHLTDGLYKCRVNYNPDIENVEFEPYTIKHIRSLKLLAADTIRYSYKFADRSPINQLFAKRGNCDDILIVKNGLIADTSYANIAFWDGQSWFTPAIPLLPGTARARLIHQKELQEANIKPANLDDFSRIRVFNAMMDVDLPMNEVRISS
jgi:4-amino-4-deoxychorismate lyase